MNTNPDELERSTADFLLFTTMFLGFVLGTGGVITTSIPGCITGLCLLGVGLAGFLLKGSPRL
jgi:hypothetical protein